MPLPVGHTVIGLTTCNLFFKNNFVSSCKISDTILYKLPPFGRESEKGNFRQTSCWIVAAFVTVLANLPDIDVIIGLILQGNGNAFHRGPTHSLVFALIMGLLASKAWRLWWQIPKLGFGICFLLILSHVVADSFLTSSQVSFFWPFHVYWAHGFRGWNEIIGAVLLKPFHDIEIFFLCTVLVLTNRLLRGFSTFIGILFKKIF